MPPARPLSFFSRHAVVRDARTLVGTHDGTETVARYEARGSPVPVSGGRACTTPAPLPERHRDRAGARRPVAQATEHEPLNARHLAPVPFVRLEHELDARGEAHEAVRPRADRRLLEAVVTHLLDVFLRHDPAAAGRGSTVERHEVRPRLLQDEPHASRVDDLDLADALLEELRPRALVAVERELHDVRGHRIAVVELDALAQHELV